MNYKKILVTGGAGFIGSHLCKRLLRQGHSVHCLDNLSSGNRHNVTGLGRSGRFKFVNIDICNTEELEKNGYFEWADIVYHQAASKKNICLKDPHLDLKVNGGGTLGLLQLSVKYGIEKFIHASTGSVYGEPKVFPSTEEHELSPCSYYGVSKLAGERYVQMFHEQFGLNTTIFRYFHVYGSRQENDDNLGGVVAIFAKHLKEGNPITIYGSGEQVRSFTHVNDVVTANLEALTNDVSNGQVYNCASGTRTSIKELAIKMAKYYKARLKVNHEEWLVGDVKEFDVDNTKIKQELGIDFETKLNFEGI